MPNPGTKGDMVFWAPVQHQGHSCLAKDGKEGKCFSFYTCPVTAASHADIVNKDVASLKGECVAPLCNFFGSLL